MNKPLVAAAFAAACVVSVPALAYCPCYTASSSYNTYNCGVEAVTGTNPTLAEWNDIFDLVSKGPSVWGSAGPSVSDIGQGCGKPEALHNVAAKFPCELLKAIAMAESGWTQFCAPDQPADQAGKSSRTIISFDCGYGVGQVTSGMHAGETPSFDTQRVASDATYNMATGTQILASKWKATNCVGDNQPSIVEDWYTATWAYNGLAWSNNPNNPNLDPNRGVYDPSVGGSYTYQEKVFGRIENPPGASYWTSVALAYPDRADCGSGGAPPDLPEPSCASPTDCAHQRSTHVSSCFDQSMPDAGPDGSGATGGTGGAQPDAAVEPDATVNSDAAGEASLTDASAGSGGAPAWPEAGTGGWSNEAGPGIAAWQSQSQPSGCACGLASGGGRTSLMSSIALLALVAVRRRRRTTP